MPHHPPSTTTTRTKPSPPTHPTHPTRHTHSTTPKQACGLLDGAKTCVPKYLALDSEGKLALFTGAGPSDAGSERIWTAKPSRRPGKLSEAG